MPERVPSVNVGWPRFNRGIGNLSASMLNELGRVIASPQDQNRALDIPGNYRIFVAAALNADIEEGQPLDRRFSWEERLIDGVTNLYEVPGNLISGIVDEFELPATFIVPPSLVLIQERDTFGRSRYMHLPATQVLLAKVVTATGSTNAQYVLRSVDNTLERDFLGQQPLDRWAGIDYSPRAVGDLCLLLIPDSDVTNMQYLAFETPTFVTCPAPATAPPAPAGASLASLMGI